MNTNVIEKAAEIQAIRESIHVQFPDFKWPEPVMEPMFFGRLDKRVVEDRKLIMDKNTGHQWDVVSDRYELIPHEVVLHNLLMACPEYAGTPEVKLRIWNDGAGFRAEASFPQANLDTEIKVGDIIRPRVAAYSSYDRSSNYGIETGAEQLVCTNGLVVFKASGKEKRKHLLTLEEPAKIEATITAFLEDWSEKTGMWRKWAERKLNAIEMEEAIAVLPFTPSEKEKIMELPLMSNDGAFLKSLGNEATLWDLNSAATQYAKHVVRSDRRSVELESQIAVALASLGDM